MSAARDHALAAFAKLDAQHRTMTTRTDAVALRARLTKVLGYGARELRDR